ncbi:PQQ-binding-like beta-propeller repeat protein [Actinosynnema sp. NPDC023794]
MLRYMTVAGALCAGWAPFRSGGVPRPEADVTVIGLAVGVVLAAALAVGGGRPARVLAAVGGVGSAGAVWWLLVSDLLIGLTGDDLPVLAVGSLAVAVGAVGLAGRRSQAVGGSVGQPAPSGSGEDPELSIRSPAEQHAPVEDAAEHPTGSAEDKPEPQARSAEGAAAYGDDVTRQAAAGGSSTGRARSDGWRVRPVGVLAVVLVVVAAFLAPAGAQAVIVRSETRDARNFPPEPVVERPGARQWAWQPPTDVVEVVPVLHGVAVATRDGAVVALNGNDGRVEWRYARPGAPVGSLVASMDRRTVVVSFRSLHDTRAQSVVVLDADTGTPRFGMVVRSVLVETGQVMPGTRMLVVRDHEVITGYDLGDGGARWHWSPPAGCTSWFGQVAWGRTTVLVPVECADTLGVTALDEVTGRERWRHEVRRGDANGERQDVRLRATPDGAVVLFQTFGARATPDAVPNGLLDTETGRVLTRPEEPWTVRADVGVTPLVEQAEAGQVTGLLALDPTTGATTPLSVEACPRRTADLTTRTTYVRACEDNGRELTVVTQPLDGSPPTATPVRLDGSGSRGRRDVRLVSVPGAIVVTRTTFGGTPAAVVGLTG